ncbi:MCP four helix bundle domain-containing protein [Hymenobacter gummosus]|nr:MCP four helix bundle domain-containing protein [Hymenobacter gummosus]
MNPLRRIHYKAKPAGLFLIVLLVVLGSSVWEKRLMHAMNTSAAFLYQDRLLPATGLFQLNDLMYAKQQLIAGYQAHPTAARRHYLQVQLGGHNVGIDSIVSSYEATYLVAEETRVFGALKARLRRYNALEAQLLSTAAPAPRQARALLRQFDQIHADLARLNRIQQQVGQQLRQSSNAIEGDANLLSNVQIAVLVIFTLIIQQALLLDRHPLLPNSLKNFRLN